MTNSYLIEATSAAIPLELQQLDRWVLWKYVTRNGKPTKIPYQTNGITAASNTSATWNSFDKVFESYFEGVNYVNEMYSGIGFVFNGDGLVGLDIDHCIDAHGNYSDLAKQCLNEVAGYWELSPSGTGLHCITRSDLAQSVTKPGYLELYTSGRYFTFTGWHLQGQIPQNPQNLSGFVAKHFGKLPAQSPQYDDDPLMVKQPANRTFQQMSATLALLSPDIVDHENSWHKTVWAIHHETNGSEDGFELALKWSETTSRNNFSENAVKNVWDRANNNNTNAYTWHGVEKDARNYQATLATDALAARIAPKGRTFEHVNANDFRHGFNTGTWFIDGFLPHAEIGMVFGPSGSGKSFLMFDMAAAIAQGKPWRGLDTEQCEVTYVASEASEGFRARVEAYHQAHKNTDLSNLQMVTHAPDLIDPANVEILIADIIDSAQEHSRDLPKLLIIDTMAASHNGNENSSQDMGLLMRHCKTIHVATGAMVVLLHHPGKDETKGARGSTSIFAACDVVLTVTCENNARTVQVTKQKEGELGQPLGFKLKRLVLGTNAKNKEISSCVVEECSAVIAPTKAQQVAEKKADRMRNNASGLSGTILKALEKLEDDIADEHGDTPDLVDLPRVSFDDLIKEIHKQQRELAKIKGEEITDNTVTRKGRILQNISKNPQLFTSWEENDVIYVASALC